MVTAWYDIKIYYDNLMRFYMCLTYQDGLSPSGAPRCKSWPRFPLHNRNSLWCDNININNYTCHVGDTDLISVDLSPFKVGLTLVLVELETIDSSLLSHGDPKSLVAWLHSDLCNIIVRKCVECEVEAFGVVVLRRPTVYPRWDSAARTTTSETCHYGVSY